MGIMETIILCIISLVFIFHQMIKGFFYLKRRIVMKGIALLGILIVTSLFLLPTLTAAQDAYEEDDTYLQANSIVLNDDVAQQHNFHDAADEDWVTFYGLNGYPYEINVNNPGSACNAVIELYYTDGSFMIDSRDFTDEGEEEFLSFSCLEDGFYYIQIRNHDPGVFGENTGYELKVGNPDAPPLILISGTVTNALTSQPIAGAIITTDAGFTAVSGAGGMYQLPHISGYDWNIEAEAECYEFYFDPLSIPPEPPCQQKDIDMNPLEHDSDGISDCDDNCPFHSNPGQEDSDQDGVGNACEAYQGDANANNIIESGDAIRTIAIILGTYAPNDREKWGAACNSDGKINVADVQCVINKILGF
jgi:hypothetical protein